jgi:hypothetical protein
MTLTPQLLGPPQHDAAVVPEKRLLLAVLEEAVLTFQRHALDHGRRGRRLFQEADEWIRSNDVGWFCSFRNICDALGLDPGYVRCGLARWQRAHYASGGHTVTRRSPFRRLSGSRTRTVGRPIGLEGRRLG